MLLVLGHIRVLASSVRYKWILGSFAWVSVEGVGACMLAFVVCYTPASSVVGCTWEVDCMLASSGRCTLVSSVPYMLAS